MTNEQLLQQAKTEGRAVRIVTGTATYPHVRVIDLDRSDLTILIGRERRNVHLGHVREVAFV